MKNFLDFLPILAIVPVIAISCEKGDSLSSLSGENGRLEELAHEEIVLGKQLDDPYSLQNMEAALKSLYPTKAGRVDLEPTDLYVRFLPKNEDQLQVLEDMGLELLDHPMDYEILKEGDYYHDPDLPEEKITWQYAVVPADFKFPSGFVYETLDRCYITENDPVTRSDDGIDWQEVEREAFRLTGNTSFLEPQTKAERHKPSGRITIVDGNANGGEPFGVAGVKVSCNAFVKFSSTYTDRDGYYEIPVKYSARLRYRLLFRNEKGFSIGFNMVLTHASFSTLGGGPAEGKDVTITRKSDRKLFTRCVVNNTAYDWFTRCEEGGDLGIPAPPKGLRIWLFQKMGSSSACMLKHGAVVDNALVRGFLGDYAGLIKSILPDITLGLKDRDDYSQVYSAACHELAHASHFSQVGKDFWDKYISYILRSFVENGFTTYGDGTTSGAGYCEVGEMWGYYMENKTYNDRYGGTMPNFGNSFWFHPQIFRYLDERGMKCGEIFKALTPEVTDKNKLRAKLLELYPSRKAVINQVFERY